MNKIELYDNVLLVDGRKAQIVDLLDEKAFIADVEVDDEYDTITIYPNQIEKVIKWKHMKQHSDVVDSSV